MDIKQQLIAALEAEIATCDRLKAETWCEETKVRWICQRSGFTASLKLINTLIPDSTVLVPMEATRSMTKDYFASIDANRERLFADASFGRTENFEVAYKAMLQQCGESDNE